MLEKEKKKVVSKPTAVSKKNAPSATKKVVGKSGISLSKDSSALLDVNTEKLQFHLLVQNRLDQAYVDEMNHHISALPRSSRQIDPQVLAEILGASGLRVLQKIASHDLLANNLKPLSRNEVAKSVYGHFSEGTRGEKIDSLLQALDSLKLVAYNKIEKLNKNNQKVTVRYEIGATMVLNRLLLSIFERAEKKLPLEEDPQGVQ